MFLLTFSSCQKLDESNQLQRILSASKDPIIQKVVNDPGRYEAQVLYLQIDRDENQKPLFTRHTWHFDSLRYFYPASTVKMPTAILAMEKLRRLNIRGLDKDSRMEIDSLRPPQSSVTFDPTAKDSIPTIGHYVKHIFLVSDNDANNRLYEFVGQDELHEQLRNKDYKGTRIIHRLANSSFGPEENKTTNALRFFNNSNNEVIYDQLEKTAGGDYKNDAIKNQMKGEGFIDQRDSLINVPFDFRAKNFFPLNEQAKVVQAVMFPNSLPQSERFELNENDLQYIRREMSRLPKESRFPNYSDTAHYDSYVKFFIFGDQKKPMPEYIRIFNKVGWAYGYLTDCAYIVDFKNNVEFILASTISVNENQIYNDGQYEYEEIGLPFLSKLGTLIYEHELRRPRKVTPDLATFKFDYKE